MNEENNYRIKSGKTYTSVVKVLLNSIKRSAESFIIESIGKEEIGKYDLQAAVFVIENVAVQSAVQNGLNEDVIYNIGLDNYVNILEDLVNGIYKYMNTNPDSYERENAKSIRSVYRLPGSIHNHEGLTFDINLYDVRYCVEEIVNNQPARVREGSNYYTDDMMNCLFYMLSLARHLSVGHNYTDDKFGAYTTVEMDENFWETNKKYINHLASNRNSDELEFRKKMIYQIDRIGAKIMEISDVNFLENEQGRGR